MGEAHSYVHRIERVSISQGRGWFEYGGRLGIRIAKGWVADFFLNGTAGPRPVGTVHGGVGLRVNYQAGACGPLRQRACPHRPA